MATITEDYVSFEVAKLLKEKGFPQDPNMCNTAYTLRGKLSNNAKSFAFYYELIKPRTYSTAPTLQMAMKWLREVHNIIIVYTPSVICSDSLEWISSIRTYNAEENYLEDQGIVGNYDTYEEACEAAIKYCLENLI